MYLFCFHLARTNVLQLKNILWLVMCDQEVVWFYTRCGGSFNVHGLHKSQGPCYGMD